MVKKGIFGGTFDPIHNGHLYIAREALKILNLNYIVFMPSGNPPHKTVRKKTDASIRYELVNMAIREEKQFILSSFEIDSKGLSYTYKTLEHFNKLEPDTKWFFITGADCLVELDMWRSVDRILDAATLVVFNRPGYNKEDILRQKEAVEKKFNKEIIFLDIEPMEVSSTAIKSLIREGKDAAHLLPENIRYAASELGLYDME